MTKKCFTQATNQSLHVSETPSLLYVPQWTPYEMYEFKMALSIRRNVKSVFRYITKNNYYKTLFKAQLSTGQTVRKSSFFAVLLFDAFTQSSLR